MRTTSHSKRTLEQVYASLLTAGRGTQTIQLFVAPTVDALCCCAILSSLFRSDGLQHCAVAVSNYDVLRQRCRSVVAETDVHSLIFIDCGASVDLLSLVGDLCEATIYVMDSHRPFHHSNITSRAVHLLIHAEYPVPPPPSLDAADFREYDEDLRCLNDGIPAKHTVLARKTVSGEYYSESPARIAYALAKAAGKQSDEFVWYAAIGVADQFVSLRIDLQTYQIALAYLIEEVSCERLGLTDPTQPVKSQLCVKQDTSLLLLRHWTLYDSFFHTREVATRLGIWNPRKREAFDVLIADMGIPLVQAHQHYKVMPVEMRNKFLTKLDAYAKTYNFGDIFLPVFFNRLGADMSVSNIDASHAVAAAISAGGDERWQDPLLVEGLRVIESKSIDPFEPCFRRCIETNKMLVEIGSALLSGKNVINEGNRYRYTCVNDAFVAERFRSPDRAVQLAQFLAESSSRRYRKWLPIVLAVLNTEHNTFVVVGFAGAVSAITQNSFGDKFNATIRSVGITALYRSFDSAVTEIPRSDLLRFRRALRRNFDSA